MEDNINQNGNDTNTAMLTQDVSKKCYGCCLRNHIRANCPQNADNNTNYVNRQRNGYQPLRFQRGNQHFGNNYSQRGYQYLGQQRGQYNGHGGAQRGNHYYVQRGYGGRPSIRGFGGYRGSRGFYGRVGRLQGGTPNASNLVEQNDNSKAVNFFTCAENVCMLSNQYDN
ncbi:hypothetical protein ILUMI_07457 [Ignelater luminosus]|uniref:Uncharacterized protein n=1 Tax=Ignelater luminosus TaxID=2038154 RepID=A0A8K0D3I6_IGNLU|nr:hypothetical protein ILUMI_07457 [Ignelater luminosus]